MSFSFNDLNLSGVEISTPGGTRIPPGAHVVKVAEAKLKKSQAGGTMVELKLVDSTGRSIQHWINVHVPSSAEATRIGRGELLALTTYGGHPTPDKPGDINTLKGMKVGVVVVAEDFTDRKTGEVRPGSEVSGYIPVAQAEEMAKNNPPPNLGKRAKNQGGQGGQSGGGQKYNADLDDEIPF